jgi:hypothetical protein
LTSTKIRISGLGIFSLHPSLTVLYYCLLGARIGKDVFIDDETSLYECDLITLEDGCHLDTATLRGFCVERDSHFRLGPITIGRNAFINTHTSISPGIQVPDGSVYGPHASSYDAPSPTTFAAYNRTLLREPRLFLRVFVAWPIIALVIFFSCKLLLCVPYIHTEEQTDIPWMLVIYAMVVPARIHHDDLNDLEAVIYWFASPTRLVFYALSRSVRALVIPLIQLALGILVKRAFGLNSENNTSSTSQIVLLRRYINSILLSPKNVRQALLVLGSHYDMVAVSFIPKIVGKLMNRS